MLYTSLTLVLVLVLATLTITASQTPPPAIAEFAPEAVEQIKEAPLEQTSQVGEAEGLATGSTTTTSTTTAPGVEPGATTTTRPAIERARVRRCVGNPPRQIEDPQSPPCVPFWAGDNGGATAKGVTANEIVIGVNGQEDDDSVQPFQTFFNQRFELYGRQLKFVPQPGRPLPCEEQKASAVAMAKGVQAFAAIGLGQGNEWCYEEELARLGVIGITESIFPEAWLAERHPHLWQYPMGIEDFLAALGQWTCARLAGRPAAFADGTDGVQPMSSKQRKFGLMLQPYGDTYTADPAPLERELARCGETLETFVFPYGVDRPEASTNAVLQMKTAGVTTAYCLCTVFQTQYLPQQATSQGWFPEWVFTNYGLFDQNYALKGWWADAEQRINVLGITAEPRQWPYADTPLVWALTEEGSPKPSATNLVGWERVYRMLLLLASGIQMAGPNLTPETFAAGLQATAFPNPDHPLQAGRVGFTEPNHTMTIDFAEFWWSETAPSPYDDEAPGSFCYVDGGRRRTLGQWATGDDVFFRGTCDSGVQGVSYSSQ